MISLPGGEPYALPLLHMGDGRVPGRLLDRFQDGTDRIALLLRGKTGKRV
jgi:hypothetical protein